MNHFLENERAKALVKGSVDYLITLRFPSGNYPSSLRSDTDKLVHWCHGSPGFIHMFMQAYRVSALSYFSVSVFIFISLY